MATNAELIEQIKAINPDAQTDGLKNEDLRALLKTTKESVENPTEGVSPVQVSNPTHIDDEKKVADAAAKAQAEADAAAKAQAEADAAAKAQAEADAAAKAQAEADAAAKAQAEADAAAKAQAEADAAAKAQAEADAAAKAQAEADAAAKAQAEADAAAKAQAEADAAEPTEPVYVVAEGASITSKKGILDPGSEVKAQYFAHNGEEILNSLLDRGLVEVK
ncbi:hypothetical protein Scuro_07 [Acinetobacter phage Scuro]|nr:hypothetical protein Scuro_07 [Acinetobacter phage Scuro]